jgi:hypothetical protein
MGDWIGRPAMRLVSEAGVVLHSMVSGDSRRVEKADLVINLGVILHHFMGLFAIGFVQCLIYPSIIQK